MRGALWGYSMRVHGKTETPETVSEVVSILEMWSMIESYYERLLAEDIPRQGAQKVPNQRTYASAWVLSV